MASAPDPYSALGVSSAASDAELRHAYRELVKRHHPDHNGGSAESAARFEEVQTAYARVLQLRAAGAPPGAASGASRPSASGNAGAAGARAAGASSMDARIAAIEREIAEQQRQAAEAARKQAEAAREAARAAAMRAAAAVRRDKPSREELGYVDSDDSFSSIFADALDEIAERLKSKP